MIYSFIIRKAEKNDAINIQKIMKNAFSKYIKFSNIKNLDVINETIEDIENEILHNHVFIALIDNIPVGTVRVKINKDQTAELSRFGVNTEYHNIGIGKALINLVDKLLISKNVKKVFLYTASKYKDLVRFYYGRGFYVYSTSTERGYIRALMVKEY